MRFYTVCPPSLCFYTFFLFVLSHCVFLYFVRAYPRPRVFVYPVRVCPPSLRAFLQFVRVCPPSLCAFDTFSSLFTAHIRPVPFLCETPIPTRRQQQQQRLLGVQGLLLETEVPLPAACCAFKAYLTGVTALLVYFGFRNSKPSHFTRNLLATLGASRGRPHVVWECLSRQKTWNTQDAREKGVLLPSLPVSVFVFCQDRYGPTGPRFNSRFARECLTYRGTSLTKETALEVRVERKRYWY